MRVPVANVHPLGTRLCDAALVEAAQGGQDWARAELYQRHGPRVRQLLVRLLGFSDDVDDLLQDVFCGALQQLHRLHDPAKLSAWLTSMAVLRTRKLLRSRRRWSWLRPGSSPEADEVAAPVADESLREAMKATYRILDCMDTDERLVFVLRFVEGMELLEVAAASGISLATTKRRLRLAVDFFRREAAAHPLLVVRLRGRP